MATKRFRYTRMCQRGGNDGYCYCVDVKNQDGFFVERVNGLTRTEAIYYRDKFEREEAAKRNGNGVR